MTSVIPRSLQGEEDALAIRDLDTFGLAGDTGAMLAGPTGTANGFESMYGSAVDTVLHGTAKESFDALALLKKTRSATLPAGQRRGLSRKHLRPKPAADRAAHQGERRRARSPSPKSTAGTPTPTRATPRASSPTRLSGFGEALAALSPGPRRPHGRRRRRDHERVRPRGAPERQPRHRPRPRHLLLHHGRHRSRAAKSTATGRRSRRTSFSRTATSPSRPISATSSAKSARAISASPCTDMAKLFPNYTVDAQRFRNFCTA